MSRFEHSPLIPRAMTMGQPSSPSRTCFGPIRSETHILWMVVTSLLVLNFASGPALADGSARTSAVNEDRLLDLVDEAIERTSRWHLDFQRHTPWQILHGLLALRENYVLRDGDKMVNAIDWLSNEAQYRGRHWFEATRHGARAHPYSGTPYEFEGHVNQSLAIIAMCNLPPDHEFKVAGGRTVTMADMINHAKLNINPREEATWTLWFLTHYLEPDEEWITATGQPWSMERLIRQELRSDPNRAPCGGTHGLFALAYVRNSYLQKHGELRGAWLEADQKVQRYVAAARSMQNRDGSFSSDFFRSRGFSNDFNERIKTSGHMVEWLMMALPRRQLDEQWLRDGVRAVANDLIRNSSQPADCGPLYHALNSLIMYRERVQPRQEVAVAPPAADDLEQPPVDAGPPPAAETASPMEMDPADVTDEQQRSEDKQENTAPEDEDDRVSAAETPMPTIVPQPRRIVPDEPVRTPADAAPQALSQTDPSPEQPEADEPLLPSLANAGPQPQLARKPSPESDGTPEESPADESKKQQPKPPEPEDDQLPEIRLPDGLMPILKSQRNQVSEDRQGDPDRESIN